MMTISIILDPVRFTIYEVYPGLTLCLLLLAIIVILVGIVFLIKRASKRTVTMVAALLIALALIDGSISLIAMQEYSPWPLPIFGGLLGIIGALLFFKSRR